MTTEKNEILSIPAKSKSPKRKSERELFPSSSKYSQSFVLDRWDWSQRTSNEGQSTEYGISQEEFHSLEDSKTRRLYKHMLKAFYAMQMLSDLVDISGDRRGGVPVVKSTRVKVSQVLAQLAEGDSIQDLEDDLLLDSDILRQLLEAMSVILDRPGSTNKR